MSLGRTALSCLLAAGLTVPLLANPAQADTTSVSAIALDTLFSDGSLLNQSSSLHSPSATITATSIANNGYQLRSQSGSSGDVVSLTPPMGTTFTAGQTYPTTRSADTGDAGLVIDQSSCTSVGSLTIDSLTTNSSTALTSLAAHFTWRCKDAPTDLYGTLRYLSTDYVAGTTLGRPNFASGPVGTTTSAKVVTLVASGTLPLVLGTAGLSGTNPGDFALSHDTCSGQTLAAGSSCTVSVTADPTMTGSRAAVLQVPSNTARGVMQTTLNITGTTTPGAASTIGTETATNGVRVTWGDPTDNGGSPITSYQVYRGTSSDDLSLLGTTPGNGYGDKLSSTTATGTTYTYAVKAVNNAGVGPLSTTITGTTPTQEVVPSATQAVTTEVNDGTQNGMTITAASGGTMSVYDASELSFAGSLPRPGTTDGSTDYSGLSVFNRSNQQLTAGSFPVGAVADATHVAVSVGTSATTCALTSGTLTVTAYQHDVTGALAVLDEDVVGECNGTPASASVRLGVDRAYPAASVPTVDAGAVPVGASKTVTETYSNTGTTTLHVGKVVLTAPDGSAAVDWALGAANTCTGAAISPGQSCSADLVVTPTAVGTRPAVLVITDDSALGTHARDLTVQGLQAPIAPSNISASRTSGKVTLSWYDGGDVSDQASSFQVLRGTSAANVKVLTTVTTPTAGTSTSWQWTDSDVSDGTRFYEIRGINAAGTGPSASDTLDLGIDAPTNVYSDSTTKSTTIGWNDSSTKLPKDPITGYAIYRGTSSSTLKQVGTVGTALPHLFTTSAPAGGATAFFAVASITSSGQSPRSSILTVTGPRDQLVIGGLTTDGNFGIAVSPTTSTTGATTLTSDGFEHDNVAVSPNGTMVAYTDNDPNNPSSVSTVAVRRVDGTGNPLSLGATPSDGYGPAWSPDGKYLAFTQTTNDVDTVCKVLATGGTPVCLNRTGIADPSWLDNSTLVVTDESSATAPLLTITWTGTTGTLDGTDGGYAASVSPDGTKIAYLVANGDGSKDTDLVRVLTRATGISASIPSPTDGELSTPSWSRDGKRLYFTGNSDSYSNVYEAASDGSGALSSVGNINGLALSVSLSAPDTTAPTVSLTGVPATVLGTSVTPHFSGSDAINGVTSYTLSYRKAAYNGGYGATSNLTLTSPKAINLARGDSYCFTVKATDRVGNTSAATAQQCVVSPLDDRSLTRAHGFTSISGSAYYAGTAARATAKGATLSRTGIVGEKQVFLVVTTCKACGTVDVTLGSTKLASVSLASASTVNKKVIALAAGSARNGTLTVKVTSSGKQVTVDGVGFKK